VIDYHNRNYETQVITSDRKYGRNFRDLRYIRNQRRIARSGRKRRIRRKTDKAYLRLGACARRSISSWIRSCWGPPPFASRSPLLPFEFSPSPFPSSLVLSFRWGKSVWLFLYTAVFVCLVPEICSN